MTAIELGPTDPVTPAHLLATRDDGLAFLQCVESAAASRALLEQIDRLAGTNLLLRGSPIDLAIDAAAGRTDADIQTLLRFVWNTIFLRTPALTT